MEKKSLDTPISGSGFCGFALGAAMQVQTIVNLILQVCFCMDLKKFKQMSGKKKYIIIYYQLEPKESPLTTLFSISSFRN